MANPVIFRRGISNDLPTLGSDADSIYFIEDKNILYKSTGVNKPLARYSDVQSGFTNLADLKAKVPVGVDGKLYLLDTNHIYFYADSEWKSIVAEAQLDEIDADKVVYDSTTSSLTSITVQDAIDELDVKVEANKDKITEVEGILEEVEIDLDKVIVDVATNKSEITIINSDIADIQTDVETNFTAITTLQSDYGKVKLKSTDTADYLENKINTDTLQIKYNKLTAKSLDGMLVTIGELNQLSGVSDNLQIQIDNLIQLISDTSGGLSYIGKFATSVDLDNYVNPKNGDIAVVENTDGEGSTELHIYSETSLSWESIGQFEFASEFKDLKGVPSTYEADMFLKSDGSQLVYSKVKYSELQGKPNVAVYKIEDAVGKSHEHNNTDTLNKLSETDGRLVYANKELLTELQWTSFEF